MATASDLLRVATGELGKRGTAWWGSSTDSVYNRRYGMAGYWCAMFVSVVARDAGCGAIIPWHAWTVAGRSWFIARGQWHNGTAGIRRGDIVYYRFGGTDVVNHVGIVESVNGNKVTAIEGNTSSAATGNSGGCVARRVRDSYIVGYGRPAYTGTSTPAATPAVSSSDKTTRDIQWAVGAVVDGVWGADTDKRTHAIRQASRYRGGRFPYGVAYTQAVCGTTADGVWGKNSSAAHDARVRLVQNALKANGYYSGAIDGIWGAGTDAAFVQAWRDHCRVK